MPDMSHAFHTINRHVARFREMELAELVLFLEAWRYMLGHWTRRRLGCLPDTWVCGAPAPNPQAERRQRAVLQACQLAVNRAERYHFPRSNCLLRSLTLMSLLRRRGIEAVLRIGVARDRTVASPGSGGERATLERATLDMAAHAWVDSCGVSIGRHPPPDGEGIPDYRTMSREHHIG